MAVPTKARECDSGKTTNSISSGAHDKLQTVLPPSKIAQRPLITQDLTAASKLTFSANNKSKRIVSVIVTMP
jgi:hypothetical protein